MNFSGEQQEYLKGFAAGPEALHGKLAQGGGGAPADAMRAAQDAPIAAGGKLTPEEQAKRDKHPLDRWEELTARADAGAFPKGAGVLMTKYHGLFFVAPAQNSFMTWLRIPGGIMTSHQMLGAADSADELADRYGSGEIRLTVWQSLVIPNVANPAPLIAGGKLSDLHRAA